MDVNGGQSQHVSHGGGRKRKFVFLSLKTASLALLLSMAILVLAVVVFAIFGKGPASQTKYVDGGKIQAVFINGSNTPYFGRITTINDRIIRLSNIYYLRVNQQIQPDGRAEADKDNPLVLVKLGCEIHGPEDSMVINQQQVIFWENLDSEGKVAQGIKEVEDKYGGDCKQIEAATQAAADQAKKEQ